MASFRSEAEAFSGMSEGQGVKSLFLTLFRIRLQTISVIHKKVGPIKIEHRMEHRAERETHFFFLPKIFLPFILEK